MTLTVPGVLAALSSNPRGFLEKTRIRCLGGSTNGSTMGTIEIMGDVPTFTVGGATPNLPMWSFRMIPSSESIIATSQPTSRNSPSPDNSPAAP